jgi:serine/threonine protein kinase
MSPEIYKSQSPFDGYAVDMWALGPILFRMVAGRLPYDVPDPSIDQRFFYISNGHLQQLVTHWNLDLSADLVDLLQRMFWLKPEMRLSLNQVKAHPWMQER